MLCRKFKTAIASAAPSVGSVPEPVSYTHLDVYKRQMFSSIILFGSFFLFLALGVPIAFVLIVATVSYALLSTGDANLALVPQRIIYGLSLIHI